MPHPLRKADRAISIRDMRQDDIPAVTELAARIWHEHYPDIISATQIEYMLDLMYSPQSLEKQLRNGHRFWLAYHGSTLAGYGSVEARGLGNYFLHKLYVEITQHGKGAGSALLKHITETTEPKEMSLHVNRANIKAINFYYRHGFAIERLQITDIGSGYVMDDFLMRKVF